MAAALAAFSIFSGPAFTSDSNKNVHKPIEIRIDSPPSKAPFGGFVGGFDKNGKPTVRKFSDPNKMSQELGVTTDQVLHPSKYLSPSEYSSQTISAVKTAK